MTVEGEHVYHVSTLGGLAHNNGCAQRVPQYDTPFQPLANNQRTALQAKVDARTISKQEYQHLQWDRRFGNRRQRGVSRFWAQERRRLKAGEPGTRNWSQEQIDDILRHPRPKTPHFGGEPIEGHHRYNALNYPQLADDPSNIYPATVNEHFYRWHGSNTQVETFGQPLNPSFPEEF